MGMSRECVRFSSTNNNGGTAVESNASQSSSQEGPAVNSPLKKATGTTAPKKPPSKVVKAAPETTPATQASIIITPDQTSSLAQPQAPEQVKQEPLTNQSQETVPEVTPTPTDNPIQSTTTEIIDSAVKQLAICDRILSIAQSHQMTCSYTRLKREQLVEANTFSKKQLQLSVSSTASASTSPREEAEMKQLEMWRCLCALTGPDTMRIVEFAKRIPDFKAGLAQSEQIVLLKAHFFKVWLVRICCMFDPTDDSLTFDSGYCITRDQLELVYGPQFVHRLIEFARAFSALKLNDIEVGLLGAIILTSLRGDSCLVPLMGVQSKLQVDKTHEELQEALQFEIRNRLRSADKNAVSSLLGQISELSEQLDQIGLLHNQQLQVYRQHRYKMKLPNLLSEIYEIENGTSTGSNMCQSVTNQTKPVDAEIEKEPYQQTQQHLQLRQQEQQQTLHVRLQANSSPSNTPNKHSMNQVRMEIFDIFALFT